MVHGIRWYTGEKEVDTKGAFLPHNPPVAHGLAISWY